MFHPWTKRIFDLDDFSDEDGTQERKRNDPHSLETYLTVYRDSTDLPIRKQGKLFECATSIGLRDKQEDRVILIPELFDENIAFAGVFDGTSGEEASQFACRHIGEYLMRTSEMKEVMHLAKHKSSKPETEQSVKQLALLFDRALGKAYKGLDRDLLLRCEERNLPYVASTAVTALVSKTLLTVAHIGDSRGCIFKKCKDSAGYIAEWLTVDHKPNRPDEFRRIKKAGGIVAFKGMKPYLREGDFLLRQERGERPKQINYSRALGAKNLKKFGLIAEPEINHFELTEEDKFIILGSDGLWDSLQPVQILSIALAARDKKESMSYNILQRAIEEMPKVNVLDNISVIAISLENRSD